MIYVYCIYMYEYIPYMTFLVDTSRLESRRQETAAACVSSW